MISIPYLICSILSFVPAIVCHEACHGFAAYKLGDPTAKRAGRLSFNPLKHIDPFGTVIMPLLLMAMNMPVFGYAKPVPYNPAYFKDPRKGDLIVGLAGPAANLVLAVLGAVVYTLVILYLMFFNLLPIPPLDGSSIFAFFLPQKYLPQYYKVQRYAMPVFLIVVLLVPYVLHFNPIGIYLDATAGNVFDLLFSFGR